MALRIVQEDQPRLLQWAAERCGERGWPERAVAIGSQDEWAALQSVIVMVRYCEREADIHFASNGRRRFAAPRMVAAAQAWMFVYHGVPRARAMIPERNFRAIMAAMKFGFRIDGRTHNAFPSGDDGILLSMRPEDAYHMHKYGEF